MKYSIRDRSVRWLLFCILSVLCILSCSEEEGERSQLQVNIKVVNSLSAGIGDEITFDCYTSGDTPQIGDILVFQSAGTFQEYEFPIVRICARSFSVLLKEKVSSGEYVLLLRRGDREQTLGKIFFRFIERPFVEEKDGYNVYGQIVCDGAGVPGVLVSDGVEVVETDRNGVYYIRSQKKYNYVWFSVPSGYEALSKGVLPIFSTTLAASVDVNERIDFELVRTDNREFTMYILGDMHLANRIGDLKQFGDFAKDLNRTIQDTPGKEYVLTLGDMTWDLYWYNERFCFDEYLEVVNSYFENIQFFHTMGNHDNDYERFGDFDKEIPYREHLTPTFYSYNIGEVHFIVMDNIDYNEVGAGSSLRSHYVTDITADQMNWLRKDLSHVDKDTPIVFSTHAPIFRPDPVLGWKDGMTGANAEGEANTNELVEAFRGYTVHFFTGHTHKTFVYDRLEEDSFMEHNAGSLCGSWWWSGHLTPGINLAPDGAPGGYTILTVKGKELSWQYKATGYPVSHQFHSYDMNEVRKSVTLSTGGNKPGFAPYVQYVNNHLPNSVLLNIWNCDPAWKISVKENGHSLEVRQVYDYDPLHIIAMTAKRFATDDNPNFCTEYWNHFFEVLASSEDSDLEIEVTDRFGNIYKEYMRRPKVFTTHQYLP